MDHSAGEAWVLNKICELTLRCGASPVSADINFTFNRENANYQLASISEGLPEDADAVDKVRRLLGLNDEGYRNFSSLTEVDEAVDHALSLAPRARYR